VIDDRGVTSTNLTLRRLAKIFRRSVWLIATIFLLSQFATAFGAMATFSGTVTGATLEVSGATVTVFSTNSGGASPVGSGTSDSSGNFSFSFSNPGGNSVLYAIATGGDVGHGVNTAIAMMAILGTGENFAPSVTIDEITTVASVWSMAQFIQTDGSISGPSPSLENAAATVPSLSYLPGGFPSIILLSTFYNTPTKLNSLADILVPCIASAGVSSAQCAALFLQATPPGGVAPNNALRAAENIARHPTANVTNLFAISGEQPVFSPILTQAPPAWTLSVQYAVGGNPIGIAIDGEGNVWAANFDGAGGLTKMGPGGVIDAGSPFLGGGLGLVSAVAIDGSDHVWAANSYPDKTVSELDLSGAPISPESGYPTTTNNENRSFEGIAIDPSGNVWLSDNINNSLVELNSGGSLISPPTDFKGGGIHNPARLAVDRSGRVWVANNFVGISGTHVKPGSVSAFDSAGRPLSPKKTGYTRGGLGSPVSIAIDGAENVWIADLGYEIHGKLDNGGATKLNSKGAPLSPKKGFQSGGIFGPDAIAIDGDENVWLLDNNHPGVSCGVSELNSKGVAISPPSGYVLDGYCDSQHAMAIDGSGNIWIANTGISTIIEMVGAASPVKTPIVGPAGKL
jgi:sugar lactone lactonase YvrE